MSIANYSELKTAVANWLNRDDLAALIPDFIFLGENALYDALRAIDNEKSSAGTLTTDYFALPGDYKEAISLVYNGVPLERISTQKYNALKSVGIVSGIPVYWVRDQGNIRVLPYEAGSFQFELVYWSSLQHLSDTNSVNPLLTSTPELFLSFALIEAALYLNDMDGTEKWTSMAKRAVDRLNTRWYDESISGSTQTVTEIGGGYGT